MAATAIGGVGAMLPRCCCVPLKPPRRRPTSAMPPRCSAGGSRIAAVSSLSETAVDESDVPDFIQNKRSKTLACPICYNPLVIKDDPDISLMRAIHSCCFVSSGSKEYSETMPAATELFRSPLVSFLYERGWRQNFIWGGFPGPESEFEMAQKYLNSCAGGIIIDASCGSGLFSRLFAKSGLFSLTVALDFSENMLRQCNEFINQESLSKEDLILVRADISRLPFVSSSIDAVHAGAALHCWPSPSTAVAEISRVLRPGGVFVATTFILDVIPPVVPILQTFRQFFTRASSNYLYLSEGELEDLCRACGFVGFTSLRNGAFVMISATKSS